MTKFGKWSVAIVTPLFLGAIGGYILGYQGKGQLREDLRQAQQKIMDTRAALSQDREACQRDTQKLKTANYLCSAREALYGAITELASNNFGLANQHLAQARSLLQETIAGVTPDRVHRLKELQNKISNAQALALRLTPETKNNIKPILQELKDVSNAP